MLCSISQRSSLDAVFVCESKALGVPHQSSAFMCYPLILASPSAGCLSPNLTYGSLQFDKERIDHTKWS